MYGENQTKIGRRIIAKTNVTNTFNDANIDPTFV